MNNYLRFLIPSAFLGIVAVTAIVVSLGMGSGDGGEIPPSDTVESKTSGDAPPSPGQGLESTRGVASAKAVQRDVDYQNALRDAGLDTLDWDTDFSLHTIPFDGIMQVTPRDGIPALDDPDFITANEAGAWLGENEPVIFFEANGESKAYPLQILIWHEIVNDVIGGVPVAVTFCPLCNSAIVFDRRSGDIVHEFGVSGNLRNSDLIMYDRQTQTWWQQLTGEGIIGKFAGESLDILAAAIISFADFRTANPEGDVLSRDTGFVRPYGDNPYRGYDRADRPPFLFNGDTDERLLPKERVVAVTIGDVDIAFPLTILRQEKVISYSVSGQDLVVFFKSGTSSALDKAYMKLSRDVGATGVFDPNLDGRKLTFRADGEKIVDNETDSVWNILGKAIEGPLTGKELTRISHGDHFWFAWGAFKPDTIIYTGAGSALE